MYGENTKNRNRGPPTASRCVPSEKRRCRREETIGNLAAMEGDTGATFSAESKHRADPNAPRC